MCMIYKFCFDIYFLWQQLKIVRPKEAMDGFLKIRHRKNLYLYIVPAWCPKQENSTLWGNDVSRLGDATH